MVTQALTIPVTPKELRTKIRRYLDGEQAVVFRLGEGVS
jgi:hypothetical protein